MVNGEHRRIFKDMFLSIHGRHKNWACICVWSISVFSKHI